MKFTVFFAALAVALAACGQQTKTAEPQAQPYVTPPELEHLEQATLGAGCFWCVEAVFQRLEGVEKVISGYAQGPVLNPTYKQVCSGTTGHAEVARIFFDPEVITFAEILEVFWETHDPTTMNRQGNDVGTQYRSGIYFHNDGQKRVAELSLMAANESGAWSAPIVTEVEAIHNFFPAEDYHQNYFNDNANQPYCRAVVAPKVDKFIKKFQDKLKEEAKAGN